mgnify:CR=1 FL=1|tara:strand:- start:9603 stop:11705 length:2103 start_codon:yes stop_codon:yes gene_type:complete
MLITLKSNLLDGSEDNTNAANQFSNFFPGGLILKKNSEVGLLNCTYNIKEGFVIEGTPLQIKIFIPPDTREQIRQIPVGSYTGDELAAAIETALNTLPAMNASNNVWPSNKFKCTFDGTKSQFTLDLPWDPTDEVQYNINTDEYATNNGSMAGGALQVPLTGVPNTEQSLYYKTSDDEVFGTNSMTSVNGGNTYNANAMGIKIPALATANAYFTAYEMQATATVGIHARIALSHPTLVNINFANIQLAFDGSGVGQSSNVTCYENNGAAAPALVAFDPVVSAVHNDKFRILIPVQYAGQATDHNNAIYQKYYGGGWHTLPIAAGAQRYTIKGNDNVVFRASIQTPGYLDEPKQEPAVNVLAKAGGLLTATFAARGVSYFEGEQFTLGLGTNPATKAVTGIITGVDGNGSVTGLEFTEIGEGYIVENGIVLTGVESGQSGAVLDITGIGAHAILSTGGASYVVGDILSVTNAGAGQPDLRFTVLAAPGGVITEISISSNGNAGYVAGSPMILSNAHAGAGSRAQISLNNAQSYYPSIKNLRMTGFVAHPTNQPDIIHNPLGLQQHLKIDMDTLGPLIGLPGIQNATINATQTVSTLDETGTAVTANSRVANNLLIHLDNFPIKSKHKGGEGRCIAALPYGDGTTAGLFQDRSYNLTYHGLENKGEENHNEIRVRLTDAEGGLIQGLVHPTVINLDLRPRTI